MSSERNDEEVDLSFWKPYCYIIYLIRGEMQEDYELEFEKHNYRFAEDSDPSLPDNDASPYLNIEPPHSS